MIKEAAPRIVGARLSNLSRREFGALALGAAVTAAAPAQAGECAPAVAASPFIKALTAIGLRKGADGEAFWHYHITEHADEAKRIGSPLKYSISRVTEVIEGTTDIFDLVEFWWADRQALEERDALARQQSSGDPQPNGPERRFKVLLEEFRMPARGRSGGAQPRAGGYKMMCAYDLNSGIDSRLLRCQNEEHLTGLLQRAEGHLWKASVNRVTETLAGEPGIGLMNEYWWASRTAAHEFVGRGQHRLPAGMVKFVIGLQEVEIIRGDESVG